MYFMHRDNEQNNIAYNNNNYLSVIHYKSCAKISLLHVSSLCILFYILNNAALIPANIFYLNF